MYAGTDQGYIIIVDYGDAANPKLTNLSFDMNEYDGDIEAMQVSW